MSSCRTNRTCCFCKKLFCCAECCKRHQKNKHADLEFNCPLCCDQKFILRHDLDEKLFCHVVFNHLPLYCCLCGDLFEESKDLELHDPCKFWSKRRPRLSISERRSLLATPIASSLETKRKEHSTIDGDYNGNFVGPLTSPPELYRTTSTPMHMSLTNKQSSYDIKTPYVPNFSLKTPNISSATSTKSYASESKRNDFDSKSSSYSSCNTNQDNTPFRSIPSRSSKEEQLSSKSPSTGLMFSVMAEQDETEYTTATKNGIIDVLTDEMELTGMQGGILPESQLIEVQVHKERRSGSFKKVRFSDQYESASESGRVSTGGFNVTENEVYYEARETLSEARESTTESKEIRMTRSSLTIENQVVESENEKAYSSDKDNHDNDIREPDAKVESKGDSNESYENERNTNKENRCPNGSSQSNNAVTEQSGSSRVVMMVVVENNTTVGTSDIGPLIESSLKKLSSVTNIPQSNLSGTRRRSITSMDSYVSISSVESYPVSGSTSSCSNLGSRSSLNSDTSNDSGGLLSTVTHAVKKALRSFSGGNYPKSMSSQRMFKRENISSSSSFGNSLSSFTSCLSNNSRKRSRDFNDGSPCASSTASDSFIGHTDDKSPMPKRPRGWYKIKGREPIARMKSQLTSPRGISSETQVFSQGSLSVRNTIIPIPARAHQSTQTDAVSND